jgi:pre-mRNA-splicing factor RBM22/SLT11
MTLIFLGLPECQEQDVRTALLSSCPFIQQTQIKSLSIVAASRKSSLS